jgi:hypothetical protein
VKRAGFVLYVVAVLVLVAVAIWLSVELASKPSHVDWPR